MFDVVRSLADSGSGNIHVLVSSIEEEFTSFRFRGDERHQLFTVRDISSNPDLENFQEYRMRKLPFLVLPLGLETTIREKLAGQEEQ